MRLVELFLLMLLLVVVLSIGPGQGGGVIGRLGIGRHWEGLEVLGGLRV